MQQSALLALAGCSILQLPIWGAAMTYGILQEAYGRDPGYSDYGSGTGVIGTTMNGVMYMAMPFLFTALDGGIFTKYRRTMAYAGTLIATIAWLASSFASTLPQLIVLQGVLSATGSTLLYSSSTMYLDDCFTTHRATAYGAIFSSKNIVGTTGPIMFSALIQHLGIKWTLRVWSFILLLTGLAGTYIIPATTNAARQAHRIHWSFLKHRTFYIYSLANIAFSSGYGLPQTYLPTYAREITHLSTTLSSVMLTLFNAPGIISCIGIGVLNDRYAFSSSTNVSIVAAGSCFFTLFVWGLGPAQSAATVVVYSMGYGFFSSAFSSTWGGWIKDFESEAEEESEIVNTGMLYGFFNGARGIGYLVGGAAGVGLLDAGSIGDEISDGFGTRYGSLILFTGLTAAFGALSALCKGCEVAFLRFR